MAQWYYTANKQQMGPVSLEELQQLATKGHLRPSDLVWKEGMSEWVRASSQGLFADEVGAAPAASSRKRSSSRDDDDDYDDRPSRSRRAAGRSEDDDDDDEGLRRRRARRSRGEGMPVGLKVGLIIGGIVLGLVVVGVGLFLILRGGGEQASTGLGTFHKVLRVGDARDRGGQPHHVHNLTLVGGRTYTIEMRTTNPMLDPLLRLENAQGMMVAADDDGGGGLNSRIVYFAPQSGPHRVICTCLRGTGNYTLIVREN